MDLSLGTNLGVIIIEIVVFLVVTTIGVFVLNKVRNMNYKELNPTEYLPEDEIHTLKQVFFLILMAACFTNVMYVFAIPTSDILAFVVFDIILSVFIAITIDKTSKWHKLLVLFLVPYGSLTYIFYGYTLVGILDLIHIPVFLYLIKYYYDQFREYTANNGLGITIILLFVIVFISFIITSFVEAKDPLDALAMVSNAFTSNGYSVLGSTVGGKLNSIVLVWSGFIISGVGTATLTAALLTRHFNKKFEELEQLIKKNNED